MTKSLLKIEHVTQYHEQMETLLDMLGFPDSLVSDESILGDFLEDDIESVEMIMSLNDAFGVKAGMKTPLWAIARAMEQAD